MELYHPIVMAYQVIEYINQGKTFIVSHERIFSKLVYGAALGYKKPIEALKKAFDNNAFFYVHYHARRIQDKVEQYPYEKYSTEWHELYNSIRKFSEDSLQR